MNDSRLNDPDENRPSEYEPYNTPTDPPIETVENWDSLRGKVRTWGKRWDSPRRSNYREQ